MINPKSRSLEWITEAAKKWEFEIKHCWRKPFVHSLYSLNPQPPGHIKWQVFKS